MNSQASRCLTAFSLDPAINNHAPPIIAPSACCSNWLTGLCCARSGLGRVLIACTWSSFGSRPCRRTTKNSKRIVHICRGMHGDKCGTARLLVAMLSSSTSPARDKSVKQRKKGTKWKKTCLNEQYLVVLQLFLVLIYFLSWAFSYFLPSR